MAAVKIQNRNQVLWAIRRTNSAISSGLGRESGKIAETFRTDVLRTASRRRNSYAAAQSLRVRKGLVPKVAVGGSMRVQTSDGRSPMAGNLFFGTEWGSADQWPQFGRNSRHPRGRWFYSTLVRNGTEYAERWIEAVDKAITRYWRTQT